MKASKTHDCITSHQCCVERGFDGISRGRDVGYPVIACPMLPQRTTVVPATAQAMTGYPFTASTKFIKLSVSQIVAKVKRLLQAQPAIVHPR